MYSQSNFKKLLAVLLLLVLVLGIVSDFKTVAVKAQAKLGVTNVVWHLGDDWFADSAERGLIRAKNELGIDYKTIQLTDDSSKWESGLNDAMAATNDYDILIAGTEVMADYLTVRADSYPDKKFFVYATSVDYTVQMLECLQHPVRSERRLIYCGCLCSSYAAR